MGISVVGINHKVASVEVRERVSISQDNLCDFYHKIKEADIARGIVIVSTCNRTEFYFDDLRLAQTEFYALWSSFANIFLNDLETCCYWYEEEKAVYHLLRVAAGLDSLILGEPQIMGQLRDSLAFSIEYNGVSKTLHRLFQLAFYKCKQIRTETNIGSYAISVAYTAVQLAKQIFDLSGQKVLLLGAGETIALVAEHLVSSGVKEIVIVNRTKSRAVEMASSLSVLTQIYSFEELETVLKSTDIVIASTGAPHSLINQSMVKSAIDARKNKPMLLIDLAVPRDIDDGVKSLEDVFLYNVDDLNGIVENNYQSRASAAQEAEQYLKEGVFEWKQWLQISELAHSFQSISDYVDTQKNITKKKAGQLIRRGKSESEIFDQILLQMSHRVLHPLISLLKTLEQEGEAALVKRIVAQYSQRENSK